MDPLKKIIYNCKQATFLIEKKMIGRITFRQHIELRIHLSDARYAPSMANKAA